MGWRFRKSFTVVPGLRLNLSKSGLSASIGGAPFTLNVGSHGLMGTASIPGTGISYRQHFSAGAAHVPNPSANYGTGPVFPPAAVPTPPLVTTTFVNTAPVEEIHSASTELLTSATLKQLKELIQTAFRQQQEINFDLDKARDEKVRTQHRYESWARGFLFKRLFKKAFAKRKEEYETETARVDELEQQLKLSKISTYIEIEGEPAELYYRLRDEFAALSDCAAIWDVKTRQATDKFHERTTANTRIGREKVCFGLGSCDLIEWEQKVPHFQNAKGGDMYLYPGFILYRAAREAFSLIEYHDAPGNVTSVSFQEEDGVPSDSQVIGQTWAKANKDGSQDRRFANNYQIPIARYGALVLKSDHGLWEEFQFSNVQKLVNFANALNSFTSSFARVANA
jgi:hypothetical protein